MSSAAGARVVCPHSVTLRIHWTKPLPVEEK